MRLKIFIATFTLMTIGIISLRAQDNATEGKKFYLNFTQNLNSLANDNDAIIQIRYVVTKACTITAQYGDSSYLDSNVAYTPGVYTKLVDKLKAYTDNLPVGGTTNNKFLTVTSTEKIGLYGINMRSATTDASSILPVDVLGTHYTIISSGGASYPAELSRHKKTISVIAPTAATITIRDPAGATVASALVPAGQVYLYTSDVLATDFTGYTVEANNNVAVFSYMQCGGNFSCGGDDHHFEQMWTTNTAGKNYVVWCMSADGGDNHPNCADNIKIIALEDNTEVIRKAGGTSTTIILTNKHDIHQAPTPTSNASATYVPMTPGVVEYKSDKPIIMEHILGFAPCIKWISPIEQRITSAVLSPFVPTGGSVITNHTLHILIPAHSENVIQIKEVRSGSELPVNLTFYENTTNSNYKIAYKNYTANDDVLIYIDNPSGFLAYMTGNGGIESYIITAGAAANDLQCYFTIEEKSSGNETHYTGTTVYNHTFEDGDTLVMSRTIADPFDTVIWLLNGVPYAVTEDANVINTVKIPATALLQGANSITMLVHFASNIDTLTGIVWLNRNIDIDVCFGDSVTLVTEITHGGALPRYQWQVNGVNRNGETDTIFTYLPTNGDIVTCLLISNEECADPDTVISHTVTVTVHSRATATDITTARDTVFVCYNTSAELLALSTVPNRKFRWYDTQTSTTVLYYGATYFTPALTSSRSYFVSVEDTTGNICENDTNQRKAIYVKVYSPLVAGQIGESHSVCITSTPDILRQLVARSGGSDTIFHQWQDSIAGGTWTNISSATAKDYTPSSLTKTTYYRRIDTDTLCGTVYTNIIEVKVDTMPIINNPIVGDTAVCVGQQITLYNPLPNGGIWSSVPSPGSGVSITPAATSATITGVSAGNVSVKYTVSNGKCSTDKSHLVKVIPSVSPTLRIGIKR